ncbi:MAG: winged helix-turn-helix transcriptional regulator [Opitutaceae bacterium]|jgi:DNA-binding transcriptional ArsR family regulator|nr:winged helix-turn-helix transcriptional regulator [Opitutaceae bacterium]HRG55411.1 winged helix-turn-helix domain-containing protein [Lacunisphaera sp.]
MPNSYSHLSEEERLQEIAKILAIGVVRYLRSQPLPVEPAAAAPEAPVAAIWDLVEDETEKRILRFLHERVEADPILLQTVLMVSPMTVTRRLARLRQAGLVRVTGKTRGARYMLVPQDGQN